MLGYFCYGLHTIFLVECGILNCKRCSVMDDSTTNCSWCYDNFNLNSNGTACIGKYVLCMLGNLYIDG